MKKITILLTEYTDLISTLVFQIGGRGYTHSSISLEEDQETFYSFNYKGFAVETVEKHKRRGVKRSLIYNIEVTEESYGRVKAMVHEFIKEKSRYQYTRLGLFFCMLGLPFHWKNHYFCSQFVAELLAVSGAVPLKKSPCLYLPNQFSGELESYKGFQGVSCNVV